MIDAIRKKVLTEFIEVQMTKDDKGFAYRIDEGYGVGYSKQTLSDIGVTKEELKPIMIALRNEGMIELLPTVDCDGVPCGSGYFITEVGVQWVNEHFTDEEIEKII
jgi:hypothetical protein